MIDLISSIYKVGDYIKIDYSNSHQVVEGYIFKIVTSSLAIKSIDGKIIGIKEDEINSFDSIDNNNKIEDKKILKNEYFVPLEKNITEILTNKNTTNIENIEVQESSKNIIYEPTVKKDLQTYKSGDKIPLEKLNEIDPTINKRFSISKKKTSKLKTIGNSFAALSPLVSEEHEIENQKKVPAMGEIDALFPDREFGFIKDGRTQKNLFFGFRQIIEPELLSQISKHIPVIYTVSRNQIGETAINIHRPKQIGELLKMSKEYTEKGRIDAAISILNHILTEYPDNYDTITLKKEWTKQLSSYTHQIKNYSNAYNDAKKYHAEKNYEKAIELYLIAINKDGIESAIKDLGSLYVSIYKTNNDNSYKEKAINFMNQYVNKLSNNISTLYFLENFYYSVGDSERFISTIDLLIQAPEVQKDESKLAVYFAKKAASYIRKKDYNEAQKFIDKSLILSQDNSFAIKLQTIIDNPNKDENFESLISGTEFNALSSGLSTFIQQTLDSYNEYAGIKEKIIDSENFKKRTLREVRRLIENTIGRSRERAKYILTEAKLMQDIDPDEIRLRTELARYCNDMAKNCMYDQGSLDIVRFYYTEAFSLEDRIDMTLRQVILYLSSFYMSCRELLNSKANTVEKDNLEIEFDNSLKSAMTRDRFWHGILDMMLPNLAISSYVSNKLYYNLSYRDNSIQFFKKNGLNLKSYDKDSFFQSWNIARENRLQDYKKRVIEIKSLGNCFNIEEAIIQLYSLQQCKQEWMCSLDISRINNIINNIAPAIDAYIKSSGYRNKESNFNNSNGQIQQLIDEINTGPTKLSYEAILPLMLRFKSLLLSSFDDVIKMSEPKISIMLLSSETVVDDNNIVSLQISISNHKDSSPIKEVSVFIETKDGVTFIPENNTSYNAIDGGEDCIFKLNVRVNNDVIKNKAAALNAVCNYKSGDENKTSSSQLLLKLYSPDEFSQIPNPYAPIADGGPVPVGSNMFYGRDEFISNIADSIINSPSKQVIIYGQKRCGKSSVLLHLKNKLLNTGKTFCVFFSLGDIIQNLTESAFYYKILSSIQQELENLQFDGVKNLPQINFPSASEFFKEDEANPLNTFSKFMIRFKQICKNTAGWQNKNLVVMIDEFTYLYTEIKKGHISQSIMKQWKAVTQNERAQFSVILVGQDVVPSFKNEDYARNAFGVIQDIRLTYLQDEPARDLIEKPILDENGQSRYIGNAVSKIIEYTSRNPYYIQIFCSKLVDYMNKNKSINVTEADVNEVAKSFISGDQALEEDKFDNLIRAGETEDLQEYPEDEILAVLRQIAINSKNIGYCNADDINALQDKNRESLILKHLVDREVLEQKSENNYKIQVKLFQQWLINH